MYDDDFNPELIKPHSEKTGEDESNPEASEEALNPEAERWERAMAAEDVPGYIGPFGTDGAEEAMTGYSEYAEMGPETEQHEADDLAGANQLTSFGLDTASHIYGLGTVIRAVVEVDESGADAENPLGAIYERLVPDPESRVQLYREICKEQARNNQYDVESKIGLTSTGGFYDKTQHEEDGHQESVDAIRALRRLIDLLETSEKFADVRERAAEQGKTIVEYLVCDAYNPALTDFFNRVGEEMSEDDVEEIVEKLEEQVAPAAATEQETDFEDSLSI